MNRLLCTTLVSWQTNNKRRQRKAENYCKDFGLISLQKNLYIGSLYSAEVNKISKKFKKLLTHRREIYHSFTLCSSCIERSTIEREVHNSLTDNPAYEIVQFSK